MGYKFNTLSVEELKRWRDAIDEVIKEREAFQHTSTFTIVPNPKNNTTIPMNTTFDYCAIDEFFKHNPHATSASIYCSCSKCMPKV